ncbi:MULTISPECIES: GNAT family N-acetyltransferase [Pseudomonas]|uniref:GNAT family N-acetyltransferase n=1 Tax=Pseudomonas TaxID=286 RepID=UPI0005C1BC61|nr:MULTISPECIES: GNAT family N-acetyltransferase [Pseudomonas]KIU53896.1 GNAT family acetyltransferase [Pseudomonas putida]MCO7506156.1 GNAT family N-acetyltransferase [Pseudomonas sp. VE 267-6A]MCO7530162.1 GNAT family N-acetyltransferase [Pseudomonas sp. 2]MCP8350296.1 N-acetyltransferase [Pseudomonas sp. FBF18]MCQ0167245.1 N-acetyltransferase [Pseudomonas sp. S12(2018)]
MIRPATAHDVAPVQALIEAAYALYIPRIGARPGPMLEDYAALIAQGRVEVFEEQGQVLGVLVLIAQADGLLLDNVAVSPAAQGRGLGRQLMAHAEARARQLGLEVVRLYTNEAMSENLGLYERLGYRETHRAEQAGFRRVFMEKRLGD